MAKDERAFQTEMMHSFCEIAKIENNPIFYWKIRDDGGYQKFDANIGYKNKYIGIEYKHTKLVGKINFKDKFSNERVRQIQNLQLLEDTGNQGLIIFNHSVPAKKINRCYVLTPKASQKCYDIGSLHIEDMLKMQGVTEWARARSSTGKMIWLPEKYIK